MITRRDFLTSSCAGLAGLSFAGALPGGDSPRKKMAIICTEWRYRSHAQHMGDRFLVGYPKEGSWRKPALDVVALYVDQIPAGDLSRQRSNEFKVPIYPSIAEALRCGGKSLAVDAVLIIGEHGNYPRSEYGQTMYPRYEFFKQTADVFREDGRSVPVFNDKHLSWKWEWAEEMVETARTLGFAFQAGSSLPVTWRMPDLDMPFGAKVREAMCIAIGSPDSYDFHALEVIQCMLERREGGEKGVTALQALRGDAVWKAMGAGSWDAGGWDPRLFEACLCRSQTLQQAREGFNHRHPTEDEIKRLVKEPVAYRFEYSDGVKATMLLLNGLVEDFTFAATLEGRDEPLSTLFYLPGSPNVSYSAALMSYAEQMFLTGKAVYPVERTLLTTGLVVAGMKSLTMGQKRLETPHLDVRYTAPRESLYWRT